MSMENPYSAPQSPVSDVTAAREYEFRSPYALGRAVLGLIVAGILVELCVMAALAYLQQVLRDALGHHYASQAALSAMLRQRGQLQLATSGMQILATLVSYVVAGMWIYRVACNARALGAKGLDFSPVWSIGWYFVPFANLMQPFRAMTQIWLASEAPQRWQKLPTPVLLRVWWASWLVTNFYGMYASRLATTPLAELITTQSMLMLGAALNIVASLCFFVVVKRLTRTQLEQYEHAATPLPPDLDLTRLPSVSTG